MPLPGGMPCRRSVPVRSRNASSIDKRLHLRGEVEHHGADLAAGAGVFRHVRANHLGMGAQPPRLEHRHRRAHPEGARDIAGGGDDAAMAAADDDGLVAQRGIVALLDRRIEGVAVHMRDGEPGELWMAGKPRRAAGGAARARGRDIGKTVAAEAAHRFARPE